MLTREQKELFVKLCEEYPAGIPSSAWGFGPMSLPQDNEDGYPITGMDYGDPANFSREECAEYG